MPREPLYPHVPKKREPAHPYQPESTLPRVVIEKPYRIFQVHDGKLVFKGSREDATRKFYKLGGTKGGYRLLETTKDRLKDAMREMKRREVDFRLDTLPAVSTAKLWEVVDREKLRKYCEEVFGVPVTTEASDYFARLMFRRIDGFKDYLPLHLINSRGLTAGDVYQAASRYFG